MRFLPRDWLYCLLALLLVGCSPAEGSRTVTEAGKAEANKQKAGRVLFYVKANSSFDTWTRSPTSEQTQWMRSRYHRMLTYSPYFDKRLQWFPNAWVYKDAYAIKPSWPIHDQHPEWVLTDSTGQPLYIPYACKAGSCPQFAADFGNPEFMQWWIAQAQALVTKGYLGVRIDDVNMDWRVSNGSGQSQVPIDPRTGLPMQLVDYRRYMANFVTAVREALPNAEIVHNVIWYAAAIDDPQLRRQILASDYQGLQRGVSDRGMTGGDSKHSFNNFLRFIDFVHSLGRSIILDDDDRKNQSDAMRDYELAFYLMVNNGADLIGADGDRSRMHPGALYAGYSLDLGAETVPRHKTVDGLLRREFAGGITLVNPPGQETICVSKLAALVSIENIPVRQVCLASPGGVVLLTTADKENLSD